MSKGAFAKRIFMEEMIRVEKTLGKVLEAPSHLFIFINASKTLDRKQGNQ